MGLRVVPAIAAAAVLALAGTGAASSSPVAAATGFLAAAQAADGGFAERNRTPDASLTAWTALGLVAGEAPAEARARALEYLRRVEPGLTTDADVALNVLARVALGDNPQALLARLAAHVPGVLVDSTLWTVIALRAADVAVPTRLAGAVRAAQAAGGGWPWAAGGQPDSNDTAAGIQALVALGARGAPLRRAVAYLRTFQGKDGGFALVRGRAADAQSTAWAIQALIAAGAKPGPAAYRFLARLRRADGSYRYSLAYGTTPVWVTSQVLPALTGKPFPFVPR